MKARSNHLALACAACLAAFASPGRAAEFIDFDTYPDGSPVPQGYTVHDQWQSLGVIFTMSDSVTPAYANPHWCSLSQPNHVGGDLAVLAWFIDPATGAPAITDYVGTAQDNCWGPGEGIQMTAYDVDGHVVADSMNAGPGQLVAFGFEEPVVRMIRMDCLQQGIDDFRFNMPIPVIDTGVAGETGGESTRGPRALLRIAPNPVPGFGGGGVRLAIENGGGETSLRIYDIRGRLVRAFSAGGSAGAPRIVDWDGLDDRGSTVAPGVYLVRWASGVEAGNGRLTVVR